MNKFTNKTGSAIFEILVTIAIVAIVTVSIVASTTYSTRNALYARNKIDAAKRAQELIEWLRGERDRNWVEFSNRAIATYCIGDVLTWDNSICSASNTGAIANTPFKRSFSLTKAKTMTDNDTVVIDVYVKWVDGAGEHSSNINTKLTDWNK